MNTPVFEPSELFFDAAPYTPRTSLPMRRLEDLKNALEDMNIWVLGTSKTVIAKFDMLLQCVEHDKDKVRHLPIPFHKNKLEAISKSLAHISSSGLKNIIFIADNDYGPALTELCSVMPKGAAIPALLPNGYIVSAIKSGYFFDGYPNITNLTLHDLCVGIQNKKIIILSDDPEECKKISLKLSLHGRYSNINFIVSTMSAMHGKIIHGHDVFPFEKLEDNPKEYDAIILGTSVSEEVINKINSACAKFTQLILASTGYYFTSFTQNISYQNYDVEHYNRTRLDRIYKIIFKEHANYSDEHCQNIKSSSPLIIKNRVLQHSNYSSPHYNVNNGIRHTIDNVENSTNSIYMIGSSYSHGLFCDDKHTVCNYLQQKCNKLGAPFNSKIRYNVVNLGAIRQSSPYNSYINLLNHINLKENDIVIFIISPYTIYKSGISNNDLNTFVAIKEFCKLHKAKFSMFLQPHVYLVQNPSAHEREIIVDFKRRDGLTTDYDPHKLEQHKHELQNIFTANEIPCFDLQRHFDRPHNWNECFFDKIHTTYHGNECIADAIYNIYISKIISLNPMHAYAASHYNLVHMAQRMFMESDGLVDWLEKVPVFPNATHKQVGSIVMNCNPFTLGHKHILATALSKVDYLYLFVVEEDKSNFKFPERWKLIKEGVAEFGDKICMVPSGKFIISSLSFPEYFQKDKIEYTPDTTNEILMFGTILAPYLGISKRFFGEEPYCHVTKAHHEQMKELLPLCGVECVEIPRKPHDGSAISASRVRKLLEEGELEELSKIVPVTTFRHLLKKYRQANKDAA